MKKLRNRGFSTIEQFFILIVLTVLVSAGVYIYRVNSTPKTLAEVLNTLSSSANKTFSNTDFQPSNDWEAEASSTIFNKVEGYDYSVSSVGRGIWLSFEPTDKTKSVKKLVFLHKTIQPAKTIEEVTDWTSKQLKKYGFSTSDNKTFRRGEDKCTLLHNSALYGEVDEGSNLIQVSCFGKEVLQVAATEMKPFVEEYLRIHMELKASDITVGPLTIKSKNGSGVISSSRNAGYDIAEMLVSTKSKKTQIALFYTKDADINTGKNSGWHYVTQANDEFGFKCGDMMANPDARKALYDQVCLGSNGQVRLDTNNKSLQ